MIWDWNNPVGLGVFFVMCAAALLMVGLATFFMARGGLPFARIAERQSNRR